MSEIIKSGNLLKFSDSTFNTKWKFNHVELCQNSTFRWFEKKGDSTPKRSIVLKDVAAYLAFGDIVKQLPFKPDLKPEQIHLVIAIPHDNNRNTRLSFFLCNSESEISDWVNTMLNTVTDGGKSNPQSMSDASHVTPMNAGAPLGGPPQAGASYGGPPQTGAPYGGPPQTNAPYGGPPYGGAPQAGAPYGAQPQSGAPYGGPPHVGAPYGGPPQSGAPYGGPPQSSAPYGGPSQFGAQYGGPPPYYSAPGQTGGGPPIGFNIGGGPYAPGNPPPSGAYPQSYPNPVPNNSNYQYPRMPPNPPMNTSTNYQPGVVQTTSYPRQPGYVPGAPQSYTTTQPAPTYVIVDGKKKKKHSKIKNAAIGIAAGAATAYAANKIFGHGFGGGHGWGGYGYGHGWGHGWGGHGLHYGGSWSSLSSGSWSD